MTRLENLTNHLQKAISKPVYTLSQEVDQWILIMRLKTEVKREKKYAEKKNISIS
jgi:hypothetical protein